MVPYTRGVSVSRRRNCDTILSGCPVTARAHREAPRRSRRPKREAAQHVRATHSATRPDARRPTASGRRGVDATKRRGGGRPKHLGSRSVDAVTMRPCLALLLVTAVRAVRHGDVMRPWSPPRPPRQSAVCARPPRPKNCVRLRHGWARRPPPHQIPRWHAAALWTRKPGDKQQSKYALQCRQRDLEMARDGPF